jgi:hypothetical protein
MSITANGYPVRNIDLRIPWNGCFEARLQHVGKPLVGNVEVNWRGWKFTGAVDETRSGEFVSSPGAVIVGGLAWRTILDPKTYVDDRGLLRSTVALDLAASVGLSVAVSNDGSLGRYWARRHSSAGQSLSRVLGPWRFDLDGITRNGTRSTPAIGSSVFVLEYDPRNTLAKIFADRPDQCPIGAILPANTRLPSPRKIIELYATATGEKEAISALTMGVS